MYKYEYETISCGIGGWGLSSDKIYSNQSDFTGMDLLHVADYIITDYSAIVYEASIVEKPIYFYTYDYDKYMDDKELDKLAP